MRRRLAAIFLVLTTVGHTLVFGDGEVGTGSTSVGCLGMLHPKINFSDCDTGASLIFCIVRWEEGSRPFTIRWEVDNELKSQFNDKSSM